MFFTGYVYIYSQRSYIQNGNRPPKLCQRSYYQQHKFPQIYCTEMKFLLGAFVTVFKWDGWMRAVGNWNCTALPLLRQRSHWCYGRTRVITPIFLLPLYYSSAEGWSSNPTSRAAALWQRGRCAGQEGTAISIPFLLCSVLHPSCSRAHWMGEAPRCTLQFSGPFPHQGLLQRGCTGLGEQGQLSQWCGCSTGHGEAEEDFWENRFFRKECDQPDKFVFIRCYASFFPGTSQPASG